MPGGLGSLGGIEIGASRSFDRRGKLCDRSWPPGSSPRLPKSSSSNILEIYQSAVARRLPLMVHRIRLQKELRNTSFLTG